jgi:hypothetical protein
MTLSATQDTLQAVVQELGKCITLSPGLPNGTAVMRLADYLTKAIRMMQDYEQHNTELLDENRELYRQLELKMQECEAQQDDIAMLEGLVTQWQRYAEGERDLFTPAPPTLNQLLASQTREERCEK